jgi:GDP-4-dehydro-6-deoxy-D-mannose reductase
VKGDYEVFGIKRWRSRTENILHFEDKVKIYECDLRDATATREIIESVRPDGIFHLAAQSFVPTSWIAPHETLYTNVIGQLNIFEAVRLAGLSPTIVVAGSSEEYGLVHPDEIPVKETNPLRPLSPYGVSKVAQDTLGYQYYMSYKMKVVRTRAFNHTGPRRPPVFVCSDFAHQIAQIEKGERDPVMRVGNLEAVRDFTDVRDTVRAYCLAMEKAEPGEVYNICSGKGYTAEEVLKMLLDLSDASVKIKTDKSRLRPSDVPRLVGDSTKFRSATGWKNEIPFKDTLRDILDFWRRRAQ